MTCSQSKIKGIASATIFQIAERTNVSAGQIRYVDVVTNRCSIKSGIVCAKNYNGCGLSNRRLDGQRDQMAFRIVLLTNLSIRIGASGVEIPQDSPFQYRRLSIPPHGSFDGWFGFTVRID